MNPRINRREFIQFSGGGALGAATSKITLEGLGTLNAALATEEVQVPSGPEVWVPSVCTLCPAGCGLHVRKVGERAVKIQGNPLHPVNHGGLCPRGLAGLQALYHPDRLRAPLKNVGSRKSPHWQEVSWQEAIATVAMRLRGLRDAGQAHAVVLIDGHRTGFLSRLLRRFMAAYGSPNYLEMPSGLDSIQTAVYLQQGVTQPVAYDLDNTRYLLSFGVNVLEGWGAPTAVMRAFGRWRDSAAGRRTKFVQVEPRLSVTAARADEWVAIRPGTEAALALGIANVLITEGLYDASFVRERTFGFEDWKDPEGTTHIGFRSLVLTQYRLNDVSAMTGVAPETILRLARELGQNRPALAIGDHQTSSLSGNPYAAMAVHSLNALVGSINTAGGSLVQAELPFPEKEIAPTADGRWPRLDRTPEHLYPGHHVARLPQAILSRNPYPVQAMLFHDVNPVFSLPNGDAFRQSLSEIPLIVSFTSFQDETSVLADLVLPIPTGLERWQEAASPPIFPYAVQSISPPVVTPRHHSRHPGDVFLELAQTLGETVSEALPFGNFEEYLRRQVGELFAAQTGSVFSTSLEETWHRLLERSGWWAPTYSNAEELWEQIKKNGGWWEPTHYYEEWDRVFQTPSRRFEFFSQTLAQWAKKHPDFGGAAKLERGDDRQFLPHQPPPAEASADYPLLLLPVEVLPLAGADGANLPYLQQIAGQHLFAYWDSWLEIHPDTARKFGIADGDKVWVESKRGRAQVRARLYAGARPEVVHLPLGYGHTEGSPWGRRGISPLGLIEEHYDPLAGLPQTNSTYVKVYRS